MQIRRAHERHHAVARRPVDGDAGLHEAVAERIDVVDLVGEMAEIARFAVVLAVPVIGQLDQRRLAVAGALGDQVAVGRGGEEYQGVLVLVVDPPADFLQPQLVAVEIERVVEMRTRSIVCR